MTAAEPLDLGKLADQLQQMRDQVVRAQAGTAAVFGPRQHIEDVREAAMHAALSRVVDEARGWAEGCAQNQIDMDVRDWKPADKQEFVLADIIRIVNDAAKSIGIPHRWSAE